MMLKKMVSFQDIKLKQADLPLNPLLGDLDLPKLGVGSIWFGRKWPMDNENYLPPRNYEIFDFLKEAFDSGISMIDTAAAYGLSEKKIGLFFKKYPDFIPNSFIATKWGEEFDIETNTSITDHSLKNLKKSLFRSLLHLPKIDLLYIHKADEKVLSSNKIRAAMLDLVVQQKIRYTGASISDPNILRAVIAKDLLWVDFIQIGAGIVRDHEYLVKHLFRLGKVVVVNSPSRGRPNGTTTPEAYKNLADNSHVSIILTGTRNHLADTIKYFK